MQPSTNNETIRQFDTGATRSSETGRYDPEGFLAPIAIERFCEYMNKHRLQADGTLRASDNWQKGIPRETYMKGMWRHVLHLWTRFRGYTVQDPMASADMEEDLCALWFNVQGLLFEVLKQKRQVVDYASGGVVGGRPTVLMGEPAPKPHGFGWPSQTEHLAKGSRWARWGDTHE
jgi:hypothetical protein